MIKKAEKKQLDTTTEEKIKVAARVVFHKKGFAATRTRDIAEEAGINLALLNYYFRSKEKLFDIIMLETMHDFFRSMSFVFNDATTTLDKKIEMIAERYIDLLIDEPDIPIFLLHELRVNPDAIAEKLNLKEIIVGSVFIQQWQQTLGERAINIYPLHFMINLISLVVFPFVGSPVFKMLGGVTDDMFQNMMIERKRFIPMWVNAMLKVQG